MKVGFIGVGTMGASMASHLQEAGHELNVSDLRKEAAAPHLAKGAVWKETPREVAEGVEVVFTSLPGPGRFALDRRFIAAIGSGNSNERTEKCARRPTGMRDR